MKYCTKCKVNVHKELDNCPLCGAYLDERNDNDNCKVYEIMDDAVKTPILKTVTYVPFFKHKFNWILIALGLLSLTLNLIITPNSHWSYYVGISVFTVIFGVMSPINNKFKIARIARRVIPIGTIFGILLEIGLNGWTFPQIALEYVLPFYYAGWIVALDFLIIFSRHKNRQLFSTLIICTLFAICPQITFWVARIWNLKAATLIPFVIFFASLINAVIVFIVCTRSLKEEMERNLNL